MVNLNDKFNDLDVAIEIEDLLKQDQIPLDLALAAKIISDNIMNPENLL